MRVETRGGSLLLSVSTNVFPGEEAEAVFRILSHDLPAVRDALQAEHPPPPIARGVHVPVPFGVELRVGSRFLADLRHTPVHIETMRDLLAREHLFLFSLNAFPLAAFQAPVVKERAYEPAWDTPARLADTKDACRVLAALLPDALVGTVSTAPGTYRPWGVDAGVRRAIAGQYLEMARFLARLEEETGKRILLTIEPEPSCLFATVADWIGFFTHDIRAACATSAEEDMARAYLGLTPDASHMAVAFEDPREALSAAVEAGIQIPKVHLSAAAEIDPALLRAWRSPEASGSAGRQEGAGTGVQAPAASGGGIQADVRALLCEPRFLHQTSVRLPCGTIHHWHDVPAFLHALPTLPPEPGCARVHFHLPLHGWSMPGLRPTTEVTRRLIEEAGCLPVPPQFVTETYTWPVLPQGAEAHTTPVAVRIAEELAWAREELRLAYSRQIP